MDVIGVVRRDGDGRVGGVVRGGVMRGEAGVVPAVGIVDVGGIGGDGDGGVLRRGGRKRK